MSVYKKGDQNRDDDDKKKNKKDIGDNIADAFDNMGKAFDNFFGGKEKKWEKKGGGHTLGTAADAEAARQARLAALSASGAGSSSSAAAPPVRRPPSAGVTAAAQAAEARLAGGGVANRAPRATAAATTAAPRQLDKELGLFPGQGHSLAPQPSFSAEVAMLEEMGFAAAAAREALAQCSGNVERAVELLSSSAVTGAAAAAEPPPQSAVSATAAAAAAAATPADVEAFATRLSAVPQGGASLQMVRKLVGNVRDAPSEPKFRKVRLTNPKVMSALGGRVDSIALLAACGFRLDASTEHAEMSDESAADAARLAAACDALDAAIALAAAGGPPVPEGPDDIKVPRRACRRFPAASPAPSPSPSPPPALPPAPSPASSPLPAPLPWPPHARPHSALGAAPHS